MNKTPRAKLIYEHGRRRRRKALGGGKVGPVLELDGTNLRYALLEARALGFTARAIAAVAGVTHETVNRIARSEPGTMVHRRTHDQIVDGLRKLVAHHQAGLDALMGDLDSLAEATNRRRTA